MSRMSITVLPEKHATKYRNRVLGLLCLLMVITYLDRVCISVAGPRMQEALNIGPLGWGWVTGVFTLAYAIFEIPSGALGDRIGPRRVLTRIVLWWSGFTSLTGLVTGYYPLLLTRFFFGMGEAGAFPNASIAVARWFPVHERGRAFGFALTASQLGGAIAPLLVVPIQVHYGWRASFYVFGVLGVAWSGVCSIGLVGLGTAALCTVAAMFTQQWLAALILLSLVYGGITFQQPIMFAACLDIGGEYAGAVVGAMNTAGQIGSFVSSLAFGYLVDRYSSYNVPFVPMAGLLVIGAWLWLKVDPAEQLVSFAHSTSA